MDKIDADRDLKVVVFESAKPRLLRCALRSRSWRGPFRNNRAPLNLARGRNSSPGWRNRGSSAWPSFVERSPAATARNLALACDMRFRVEGKGRARTGRSWAWRWSPAAAQPNGSPLWPVAHARWKSSAARTISTPTPRRNMVVVNRSIPDAELDAFVDNFARRVASYRKARARTGEEARHARAGIPSEAERWSSNQAFIGTTSWPDNAGSDRQNVRERSAEGRRLRASAGSSRRARGAISKPTTSRPKWRHRWNGAALHMGIRDVRPIVYVARD